MRTEKLMPDYSAETQGKKLGLQIDVQDMGYDETLAKLKQLNKLITDPKQYTAGKYSFD